MNKTTNDNYPEYSEGGKRVSSGKKGKKKQSKAVYYVILLVLLGVLVFSAVKIISYFKQQSDASNVQQGVLDAFVSPGSTDGSSDGTDASGEGDGTTTTKKDPDPETIDVDFNSLCATYPDVVGFIYGANTKVQYPLQHGQGNDYYLNHDLEGNVNNNGSIFIEQVNSSTFSDNNTIIYGHNMKSGLMFADLRNYHTNPQSYYASHPYFYIYTPTQNYKMELFAGFVCEHDDEVYATSLTQEQLERMGAKSDFKANIGTPTGKTVTLSTCSYEYDNARYVVVGSLVPIS